MLWVCDLLVFKTLFFYHIYKTIKKGFRIWKVSFKQKEKNWWSLSFFTWFFTIACCRSPLWIASNSLSLLLMDLFFHSTLTQCRVSLFCHLSLIASRCHSRSPSSAPIYPYLWWFKHSWLASSQRGAVPRSLVWHSLDLPLRASCSCKQTMIRWWWNPRSHPTTWIDWTLAWPHGEVCWWLD